MRQEFQKPAWMNDWKVFLLFSLVSFAFAFGLRCMDFPKWNDPAFMINGEYIMGTHDAYYWLAGAKGIGSAVDNPMSTIVRFLGNITGQQYGNIAFWLPAVFAGFTAIAAFAWGVLVGGPWVGLVSGVFTSSIPAYYFRTRLSYYDTDVVTLFFPLLISVLLARWVSLGIRDSWKPQNNKNIDFKPTVWGYSLPIFAGLLTANGSLWHANVVTFGQLSVFVALGLTLLCGTKESRPALLRGLVLFLISSFSGIFGLISAVLLLIIFVHPAVRKHKLYDNFYVYLALFLAIVAFNGMGQTLVSSVLVKVSSYLKPVTTAVKAVTGPQYPGIAQSVIEAQNISFEVLFSNLTGSALLGWLGFASFAFALILRPTVLFLAPLVVVTFAAVYIGGRFSMFGGITLGLGLSFTACWLIERFAKNAKQKFIFSVAQALLFIIILFSNIFPMYMSAPATPVLSLAHAKALVEVGERVPKKSTIWTWWDWGYATMYYAGVNSFANGGHHAGPILYPLGFAFATPSYKQSNQFIKFCAANGNKPADAWSKMSASDVANMVRSFSTNSYDFPKAPKQYVVVNWESIRLAYWILYYGSWNIEDRGGIHPRVVPITKVFDLDSEKGILNIRGEAPILLSSYDILKSDMRAHRAVPGSVGPHLMYNEFVRQAFLADDFAYSSMLVQLLLSDPSSPKLAQHFRLVYEGFPMVRVYEVL